MLPLGSLGSTSSEPIAFVPNEPETYVQFVLPVSLAMSVRQTPPPAAPRYSLQAPFFLQPASASAVTRPEAVYSFPPARNWSSRAGYFAWVGPIACQAPDPLPLAFSALNVEIEFSVASNGTVSAG